MSDKKIFLVLIPFKVSPDSHAHANMARWGEDTIDLCVEAEDTNEVRRELTQLFLNLMGSSGTMKVWEKK